MWNEGPVVGKTIYEVNADYVWDLKVNVVQVIFKTGASNQLTYPGGLAQKYDKRLISMNMGLAMIAALTVEKMEGAQVGTGRRGVKFIQMGLCQDLFVNSMHGNYDGFTPKQMRSAANLEGKAYLDGHQIDAVTPWYDYSGQSVPDECRGFFAQPNADTTVENLAFKVGDRPTFQGTDSMKISAPPSSDLQMASAFVLNTHFYLYFAVRTEGLPNRWTAKRLC